MMGVLWTIYILTMLDTLWISGFGYISLFFFLSTPPPAHLHPPPQTSTQAYLPFLHLRSLTLQERSCALFCFPVISCVNLMSSTMQGDILHFLVIISSAQCTEYRFLQPDQERYHEQKSMNSVRGTMWPTILKLPPPPWLACWSVDPWPDQKNIRGWGFSVEFCSVCSHYFRTNWTFYAVSGLS